MHSEDQTGGEVPAAKHAGVTLLKTVPGIGPRTAEALVAYIDNASRFSSLKSVGSYFGLVPCQDASAYKNRLTSQSL